MRRRNKNKVIIFSLISLLFVMIVGYAAFQTKLEIKGTSNISSEWRIEITNVTIASKNGLAENVNFEHTTTTASMEANLYEKGDYVEYNVEVSNLGTLDATIDNIANNIKSTNEAVIISFSGYTKGQILKAKEKQTIKVKIEYDSNYDGTAPEGPAEVEIQPEYVQQSPGSTEPTPNKYLVTYDCTTNGSNSCTNYNEYLNESETVNLNYTSSRKGYKFIGWNTDKTATNALTELTMPSNDVTLYAIFEYVDDVAPTIEFTIGENVKGNNNWYKSLNIKPKVTDNIGVTTSKYCVTTDATCTPNQELTLTSNYGSAQLNNNASPQKICVNATDQMENEVTKCTSESYKVDSEAPTLNTITVTPDDDTMLVEVTGTDGDSGIYKYYFSKDSGNTYVESNNPNYTFTGLEEGDYLVTVYAEDKAGNKSELTATNTTIRHSAFCSHNNITNLADCVIATEAGNIKNIDEAKTIIEAKAKPDFTKISPSIVYEETVGGLEKYNDRKNYLNIGTSYTFNEKTGNYTIPNSVLTNLETIDFTSGDYYSAWAAAGGTTSASQIYKIVGINLASEKADGTKIYTISYYRYSQKTKQYDASNIGMYAIDDGDGKSYYYRGSVGGNYVKFAEKYWRIIRINGDGTLRLIYDGTSAHTNGENTDDKGIGISTFNQLSNDNTYVGYMYGDETKFSETNSGTIVYNHSGLSTSAKYYFGTNYEFDKEKKVFKLSGNLINGNVATDKVGYYTCFSTSATGTCKKIEYTTKYINSTALQVKAISYGTKSYNESIANINDSQIKSYLEDWYTNNLSKYGDKISTLSKFCNDRSLSPYKEASYNNKGYGLEFTTYGVYSRLFSWAGSTAGNPTLLCPDKNDTFTLTTANGNGKLKQPIGLITADEANLAGGTTNGLNKLYYLYNGSAVLTMTPSYFGSLYSSFVLAITGGVIGSQPTVGNFQISPVINIDPSKITFEGSGTAQDPFVVN